MDTLQLFHVLTIVPAEAKGIALKWRPGLESYVDVSAIIGYGLTMLTDQKVNLEVAPLWPK